MFDAKSQKRIRDAVQAFERENPNATTREDRFQPDQTFAKVKLFEIPSGGTWEEVASDKWRMVDCREVIKTASATWAATDYRPVQTIWFVPELFGDDTVEPTAVVSSDWVTAFWEFQSERWVAVGPGFLPEERVVFCVPTANVAAGASVSCKIWRGDPLAETTDTITVYLDWAHGGEGISSGKECVAKNEDGRWHFIIAECETDAEPTVKVGSAADTSKPDASSTTYSVYINSDGVWLNDSATWVQVVESPPA